MLKSIYAKTKHIIILIVLCILFPGRSCTMESIPSCRKFSVTNYNSNFCHPIRLCSQSSSQCGRQFCCYWDFKFFATSLATLFISSLRFIPTNQCWKLSPARLVCMGQSGWWRRKYLWSNNQSGNAWTVVSVNRYNICCTGSGSSCR